jgi:HTH-type transcriptional regulator / antitoxin HigA
MITNERQYRITCGQLEKLKKAIESFDIKKAVRMTKSKQLAKAQLAALQSEYDILTMQVQEYETLKSGAIEILKASTLEELPSILIRARIAKGLSQRNLAELMGLKEQQIQRYEAEQYASANLVRLTEVAKALAINIKEVAELESLDKPIKIDDDEFSWDRFPIKEMYRRNWFEDFSGSLSEAVDNAEELLRQYVADSLKEPVQAVARQRIRSGGNVNKYALMAWQCRLIRLAREIKLPKKFGKRVLSDEWFGRLVRLSCENDWPEKTIKYLQEFGIRLVIVPHLSNTYLDGAALLLSDGPVIGMTLRYDRIDNFWFVLFHELIHVRKHLSKGKIESIFDDLDAEADDIEKEADESAGEILVPSKKWESALARYVRSKETIEEFAKEIKVSPAIVAGKIRREADNYTILTDMIGQGKVRKQFSKVDFSY